MTIRIAYVSDTHFEHHDQPWIAVEKLCESIEFFGCDYLMLAGDITNKDDVPDILAYMGGRLGEVMIMYTPGNHEMYSHHIQDIHPFMKRKMPLNVHMLHRSFFYDIKFDLLVVGATGWIDGTWGNIYNSRNKYYKQRYADFNHIKGFGRLGREYGKADYRAIDRHLLRDAGRKIAMTHFLPTREMIETKYLGEPLNHCFANSWTDLMHKHDIDLWVCGHSHSRQKIEMLDTKIVTNCAGYPTAANHRMAVDIIEI